MPCPVQKFGMVPHLILVVHDFVNVSSFLFYEMETLFTRHQNRLLTRYKVMFFFFLMAFIRENNVSFLKTSVNLLLGFLGKTHFSLNFSENTFKLVKNYSVSNRNRRHHVESFQRIYKISPMLKPNMSSNIDFGIKQVEYRTKQRKLIIGEISMNHITIFESYKELKEQLIIIWNKQRILILFKSLPYNQNAASE